MWLEPFSLSLASPLGTAAGEITERRGLLVGLSVNGQRGIGEATPLAGWTESYDECRRSLESIADDRNNPPERPEPTKTPAAAHAVDLAVSEARARKSGQPLAAWLRKQADIDGQPPDSVPVNATIGDGNVETTVSASVAAVERGFEWLKLKVGSRSVEGDLDRVRAVTGTVGDDARIRLDANGAWSHTQARRVLKAIDDDDSIDYVEQPVAANDLDGLAALRGRGTEIAVDESLASHSLDEILDAGAADVAILKPMALGGPTRTVDIATQAQKAGLTPVVTTTVDAVVARTAAVHIAAAIPNLPACGLATGSLLVADLDDDPIEIHDGQAELPTGNGLCGDCFDRL